MKVNDKELGEISLPDFLLVGAAKSATTSLHHYLDEHPDVCMTAIKESWFFSFLDHPPQYTSPGVLCDVVSRVADYVKLFEGCKSGQLLGDASPSYLYTYEDTIRNIRAIYTPEALKKLKIVISLREPASRAFSQYYTFNRRVHEPLSFEDAIQQQTIQQRLDENWNIFYDYVGFGRYYEQVKAFQQAFGKQNVLVVLYDDIRNDSAGTFQTICKFIGVDDSFLPNTDARYNDISGEPKVKWLVRVLTSQNPIKRALVAIIKAILLRLPRKQTEAVIYALVRKLFKRTEMAPAIRRALVERFSDDVEKLESLIDRDLSHWRQV